MTRDSVALLSVSIDLGAGRRGVDMGPSALRVAGLTAAIRGLGYSLKEVGTVNAPGPESVDVGDPAARYLSEIVEVCSRSYRLLREGMKEGALPVIVGGDHSLSMGTAAAVADHHRARGESLGLIWVDAHADMNTPETTPSGNIHGMSLSVLTGEGPAPLLEIAEGAPAFDPTRVSILGARELDHPEKEAVKRAGIRVFTMSEIDERGMGPCMDEAIARASDGTVGFHLSFDLDAMDPMVTPGVGTPAPGGITYREAHLACEKAARSGKLMGFELVELNPTLDLGMQTARVGVALIESALGKSIL